MLSSSLNEKKVQLREKMASGVFGNPPLQEGLSIIPETKNKFEYLCLNVTKAYFVEVSNSTCLLKVSLVAFPIIAVLVALEAAFDLLIAAPITFIANCIAGPQEIFAQSPEAIATPAASWPDEEESIDIEMVENPSESTPAPVASAPIETVVEPPYKAATGELQTLLRQQRLINEQKQKANFETVQAFQDRLMGGEIIAKSITIDGAEGMGLESLWNTRQSLEARITMCLGTLMFARQHTVTVLIPKIGSQQTEFAFDNGTLRLTNYAPMLLMAEPDTEGGPVIFTRSELFKSLTVSGVKSYTFNSNQSLLLPILQDEVEQFQQFAQFDDLQWLSHLREAFLEEGLSLWNTGDINCRLQKKPPFIELKSEESWTLSRITKKTIEEFVEEIRQKDVKFACNDTFLLTIRGEEIFSELKDLFEEGESIDFYELIDRFLPPESKISVLEDGDNEFCQTEIAANGVVVRFTRAITASCGNVRSNFSIISPAISVAQPRVTPAALAKTSCKPVTIDPSTLSPEVLRQIKAGYAIGQTARRMASGVSGSNDYYKQ